MWVRARNGLSAFLWFGLSPGSFIIRLSSFTMPLLRNLSEVATEPKWDRMSLPAVCSVTLPPRCGNAPSRPPWWCAAPYSQVSGPRRRTLAQHILESHEVCWTQQRIPQLFRQPGAGGMSEACWEIKSFAEVLIPIQCRIKMQLGFILK